MNELLRAVEKLCHSHEYLAIEHLDTDHESFTSSAAYLEGWRDPVDVVWDLKAHAYEQGRLSPAQLEAWRQLLLVERAERRIVWLDAQSFTDGVRNYRGTSNKEWDC